MIVTCNIYSLFHERTIFRNSNIYNNIKRTYIYLFDLDIIKGVYNSSIQNPKNRSRIKKSSVRVSPPNLFTDIHLEANVNKSFIPSHRYTLGLSIFFLSVPTFCSINILLVVILELFRGYQWQLNLWYIVNNKFNLNG